MATGKYNILIIDPFRNMKALIKPIFDGKNGSCQLDKMKPLLDLSFAEIYFVKLDYK